MSRSFSQMPTLGEFILHARRRYGFIHRRVGFDLRGPRGATRIDYLWRDNPRAFAPLPDYRDDQRLTDNQVRSLCAQLGIPVEDFGLPEEGP